MNDNATALTVHLPVQTLSVHQPHTQSVRLWFDADQPEASINPTRSKRQNAATAFSGGTGAAEV